MKELFYFDFAELMVRVDYEEKTNSLCYATHREMTFDERVIMEQYLLTKVALKTAYYKQQPSQFVYLGIDRQLQKSLSRFNSKSSQQSLAEKEDEVDAS